MRRRETYNFAAEEQPVLNAEALDSAVATANLISLIDPKEIDNEEVKLLSEATGASEDFVEEMADVCNDACEACNAGHDVEEVKQHFSAAAEEVINNFVTSANFSAPAPEEEATAEDKVLQIAQITSLIDDKVLKEEPTEEVVEIIAEATETPEEVVEPIVENAKEQFSNSDTMYLESEDVMNFAKAAQKKVADAAKDGTLRKVGKKLLEKGKLYVWNPLKKHKKVALGVAGTAAVAGGAYKLMKGKKNFSEGEEAEAQVAEEPIVTDAGKAAPVIAPTIVPEPTTIVAEGAAKEGVEVTKPVEGTAQDPVKEELRDVKEGDKVQDTAAVEAALKVQNDIATVDSVADVAPAQTNFGRKNLTGKDVTEGLKGLLGSRYIPNK